MASCYNRLCINNDCRYKHAGDIDFIPSPCPYGDDCLNGERCEGFHPHHVYMLRNTNPEIVRRFLSVCRHLPPKNIPSNMRASWRKLVRTYIYTGTYDSKIDDIRNSRRSRVPSYNRGRSRTPERKRSRSVSSRGSSPVTKRERSNSHGSASNHSSRGSSRSRSHSKSRNSSSHETSSSLVDETVETLQKLNEKDIQVINAVSKALLALSDV